MNFLDMTYMSFSNLWRTRLRSALTILGVVIGIGALTSMVSFGTGMQKNMTDAFTKNDLFTSMNVTPEDLNMDEIMSGNLSGIGEMIENEPTPLTDSILQALRDIEGVQKTSNPYRQRSVNFTRITTCLQEDFTLMTAVKPS